ncbi:hypothetical protein CK936_01280 [Streptomyces albireticuli]|uniref:Berberine/berberine-like domain-containing protein n=4 Tax=Streptomyces albireticuli TaxID=1940 RepID=A0A2A2DHE0_9ACTN|nr:hypothetical protein CK936_01280 [Streptomyces albireticuli]
MGVDSLVGTKIVTADGKLLNCNKSENSDLFWACRGGGGGNFGVNTEFTFKVNPVEPVVLYRLEWKSPKGEGASAILQDIFSLISDSEGDLKRNLSAQFGIRASVGDDGNRSANIVVYMEGWSYDGDEVKLAEILNRVTQKNPPLKKKIEKKILTAAAEEFGGGGEHGGPNLTIPYRTTSVVATEPMRPDTSAAVVNHITDWARGKSPGEAAAISFFAMGGKDQEPGEDTAFAHRNAYFTLSGTAYWSITDTEDVKNYSQSWVDAVRDSLSLRLGKGAFVNFPDPNLKGWEKSYYGEGYDRLREIKNRYDPSNFFRYEQSIKPM